MLLVLTLLLDREVTEHLRAMALLIASYLLLAAAVQVTLKFRLNQEYALLNAAGRLYLGGSRCQQQIATMNLQSLLCFVLFIIACTTVPSASGQFSLSSIAEWFSNLFTSDSPTESESEQQQQDERWETREDDVESQVSSVIWSLDDTLGGLLSDLRNFSQPLSRVSYCYEPAFNGSQMDIFDSSTPFKSIAVQYYQAFPMKNITHETISNLFNSTREMITHCLNQRRRSSVQYGYTELSDWSLDEVRQLLGVTEPANPFSSNRGKRLSGSDRQCISDRSNSFPRNYDWRDMGMVTEVKNQMDCGADWAFAAVAAIESALLVNQRTLATNESLNLSEQQLISCVKNDTCQSGHSQYAFSYIKDYGLSEELVVPYVAREEACPRAQVDYFYPISDYCIRSRFRYGYQTLTENLSDNEIQRILSQVGPLYALVDGNPELFRNYRGGVIDDEQSCSTRVNHAVLLVGYDDNSWIIKNSWGKNWGDEGYFRLTRNRNMCGINTEIAWPLI